MVVSKVIKHLFSLNQNVGKGCRWMHSELSTIYALSSGHGKCGVAVIRISGSGASTALSEIAGMKSLPQPRMAMLKKLKDPVSKEPLDKAIVLWFPKPNSFTGEDCCELHVHGGFAVIRAVFHALNRLPHFRPAEPGEFTKRAFHNGKLDLTEVEGLADLIHAETEMQRKQALLQMDGSLSKLYSEWRHILLKCVAHVEAYVDFAEDENIEDNVIHTVEYMLQDLKSSIEKHLADERCGERLRDGVKTVILGEPNVGKSSLLNLLCQRPAAIVTDIPGTTRDVIELSVNIGGYPVILADTAGLRETSDMIEREGITRAEIQAKDAEIIILMVDVFEYLNWMEARISATPQEFIKYYVNKVSMMPVLNSVDETFWNEDGTLPAEIERNKRYILVLNKIDLVPKPKKLEELNVNPYMVPLSCKTEDGLHLFLERLKQLLESLCGCPSRENPMLTQARYRSNLRECVDNLDKFFTMMKSSDLVLAAQQLRKALRSIGKITGHASTDEILSVIFKDFCIGK